jgi:hypothetical protein
MHILSEEQLKENFGQILYYGLVWNESLPTMTDLFKKLGLPVASLDIPWVIDERIIFRLPNDDYGNAVKMTIQYYPRVSAEGLCFLEFISPWTNAYEGPDIGPGQWSFYGQSNGFYAGLFPDGPFDMLNQRKKAAFAGFLLEGHSSYLNGKKQGELVRELVLKDEITDLFRYA